jgi:hypothetical protein
MVKGDLYFRIVTANRINPIAFPISSSSITLPIWCAQPWVDAEIEIPNLSVKKVFTLLADSGADGTVLNVRDAISTIGMHGYRTLQQVGKVSSSLGVGGTATRFTIPAKIVFQHDDGSLEGYSFDLSIAKPAKMGSKKLGHQLRLPSLLGRDILCQFRMIMDYSSKELLLDH